MRARYQVGSKIICTTEGPHYNATGVVVGLRTGLLLVEFEIGKRVYMQPYEARTA